MHRRRSPYAALATERERRILYRWLRCTSKLGVWDLRLSKVYLPTCAGVKVGRTYEAIFFSEISRIRIVF